MNKWILAARPWSLPASVMPALIAIAYIFYRQDLFPQPDWLAGVVSLLGAALFHCAGNLISDYHDFKHGVDSHDNIGQTNLTIVDGIMTPTTVLRYGFILLGIGACIGLWLTFRCGMPVLYIGVIGTLLTVFYYRLKYTALGDLDICITFGLLIALGTAYTLTGTFYPTILLISLPSGFLIINILHANNTRDRATDHRAGIRTFAMLLGLKGSKIYYTLLCASAYLLVLIDCMVGLLPWWSVIVLLSLPIARKNCLAIIRCKEMKEIAMLDGQSAQLVMMFSLLLAASCFLALYL